MAGEEQLKCGGCGGEEHRVFGPKGSGEAWASLILECVKCKSRSVLEIPEPRITIGWGVRRDGQESNGVITGGWSK